MADDASRDTGDDRACRHISADHGARRDDCVGADPAGPEHDRSRGDPCARPDNDIPSLFRHGELPLKPGATYIVCTGEQRDPVAEECVLLYGDAPRDRVEQRIVDHGRGSYVEPLLGAPKAQCGEVGFARGGELS